tara:strand:- start:15 stop:845 length:831 start_codon:yes stop_codon:yes gene_type:complete
MKLIDRLERRFARFAIPNLALLIVMGQGLVLLLGWAGQGRGGGLASEWELQGSLVLQGQWWRLVTFVVVPPGDGLLVIFALYLFLIMGSTLESQWGTFRFNVFLLLGWMASVAAAFVAPEEAASVGPLGSSVFLAFAWLFPEYRLYLMFVFPVPIKFLAWITWFMYGVNLVSGDLIDRLLVVAATFNFALFFGPEIIQKIRSGHRRQQQRRQTARAEATPFHTCSECGVTDKDQPQMLFQFCSTCHGDHEYCEEHLRNHEHRVIGSEGVVDLIDNR